MHELTSPKPNDALATTRISRSMQVRGMNGRTIRGRDAGLRSSTMDATKLRCSCRILATHSIAPAAPSAWPSSDFGAFSSGKAVPGGRHSARRQLRTSMRSPCVAVRWPEIRSISAGRDARGLHRRLDAALHTLGVARGHRAAIALAAAIHGPPQISA